MAEQAPTTLAHVVHFAGIACEANLTSYAHGGATALLLTDRTDGSPVATATVNVPGISERLQAEGKALIKDCSENRGMMAALQQAGLVADTGEELAAGFTTLKVGRLLL